MKKAVVTGAHAGIGNAITEALVGRGWKVFTLDKEAGFDVRDRSVINLTFAKLGKIDLLVNNAGIAHKVAFEKMTAEQWDETIDVNLTGVFNCIKAALPYLDGGDIINMCSRSAVYAHEGLAAYCASKAGVMLLSEALGLDLRERGIRVGYLMPGIVNTGFAGDPLRDWHIGPEDIADTVIHMIEQPRRTSMGRVEIRPSRHAPLFK